MTKPIVVSIEHHSTKDEVKRKLRDSFWEIRAQIAPYVSSVDEQWTEDGVDVRGSRIGADDHEQDRSGRHNRAHHGDVAWTAN